MILHAWASRRKKGCSGGSRPAGRGRDDRRARHGHDRRLPPPRARGPRPHAPLRRDLSAHGGGGALPRASGRAVQRHRAARHRNRRRRSGRSGRVDRERRRRRAHAGEDRRRIVRPLRRHRVIGQARRDDRARRSRSSSSVRARRHARSPWRGGGCETGRRAPTAASSPTTSDRSRIPPQSLPGWTQHPESWTTASFRRHSRAKSSWAAEPRSSAWRSSRPRASRAPAGRRTARRPSSKRPSRCRAVPRR